MSHQEQEQFLDVIDRDEAERRFREHLSLTPLEAETVALDESLGRVLASDVIAKVDVPAFDRSNLDGYAVRASDTLGADEEHPVELQLLDEVIATAVSPKSTVGQGDALSIATGGMVPRGADAIVMIEHADLDAKSHRVLVRKPVTPGFGISYAATDIGSGEVVLRQGDLLTSRETGVLAAIGVSSVSVWRRPTVGILSTGDELIPPGEPMRPGFVYDSNSRILADAVRELGGEPSCLGIVGDDEPKMRRVVESALQQFDLVLLSGGTSKGAGDVSYRIVRDLGEPGIVAHGVALKPGKPLCLAVVGKKPVVILPGFPTSAIFTFHEFVAPVLRVWSGRIEPAVAVRQAEMAVRVNSEIGRTEYLLVGLAEHPSHVAESAEETADAHGGVNSLSPVEEISPSAPEFVAYPMGKGSGSMTTFSRADGIVTLGRHDELVEAGEPVRVRLLGSGLQPADLVVIGSHCVGLDLLLSALQQQEGVRCKFMAVGSGAGLQAAKRGECDVAGIHLLDPRTGVYNEPFVADDMTLTLVRGYSRNQGVLYRLDDDRFVSLNSAAELIRVATSDSTCRMVNRNQGSGTRVLIDQALQGVVPPGYTVQSKTHHAVAAAIRQRRADWGVGIESVRGDLGFLPLQREQFDFVVPQVRSGRAAVQLFLKWLQSEEVRQQLQLAGLEPTSV